MSARRRVPLGHALVVMTAAGLAGCNLTGDCDTATEICTDAAGTPLYSGDPAVSRIDWGCCDGSQDANCERTAFWYDLVTDGKVDAARLEIYEVGGSGWRENHTLEVYTEDPAGYWQDRYLELEGVRTRECADLASCARLHTANENTLFSCEDDVTTTQMTWAIRTYADDLQQECRAWGADLSVVLNCSAWLGTPLGQR